MLRGRARWWARGWLLSVVAVWLACGGVEGERASGGPEGGCPTGETCDPSTPEGLRFSGSHPSDLGLLSALESPRVYATRVGGTQRIGWSAPSILDPGVPEDATASSEDPAIFEVEAGPPGARSATVRARSVGTAMFRVDTAEGGLVDRVALETAELARIELRSSMDGEPRLILDEYAWEGEWAFFAGGTATAVVALFDAAGERLVDGSLEVVEGRGASPGPSWDEVVVEVPAEGAELEVAVRLGGEDHIVRAPLVTSVDRIERTSHLAPRELLFTPTVRIGEPVHLCYRTFAGDRAVAGVRPAVTADRGATAIAPDAAPTGDFCVTVTGTVVGPTSIHVTAGGATLDQPLEVVR